MKTLRFIEMALTAVLMCVNFASCSSDDALEENDINFLGTWYLSSEKACGYNPDGTPTLNFSPTHSFPYHSDEGSIWTITFKSDGVYKLEDYEAGEGKIVEEIHLIKKNTYKKNNDLFIIKSLTEKEMVLKYIDHYFEFFDETGKLINNNSDEIVDQLELIYYTFTR